MPNAESNVGLEFKTLDTEGNLSEYDPKQVNRHAPTYFITHSFKDKESKAQDSQIEMAKSINSQEGENGNVILVTWDAPLADLNAAPPQIDNYEQAAANTKTVGEAIANEINNNGLIKPESTTLIGHGLGAQASGWAGAKTKELTNNRVRNIVGLDPIRPAFEAEVGLSSPLAAASLSSSTFYKSPDKLSAEDGDRVTVIHSSSNFGYNDSIKNNSNDNTLDIYINEGSENGYANDFRGAIEAHNYAREFFIDLLDGEAFDTNGVGNKFARLEELKNPTLDNNPNPMISLNAAVNGDGGNRGQEVNVLKNKAETIPVNLDFEGNSDLAGTKSSDSLFSITRTDNVILRGLDGNDTLDSRNGDDTLLGGSGDDEITGRAGNDRLFGGLGDDFLEGNEGDDFLKGNEGQDFLLGLSGRDTLYGNSGNDSIRGHDDNDLIFGDRGFDTIEGGAGNDIIEGGSENDFIRGGEGDDMLFGVSRKEPLVGSSEIDTLIGGSGRDLFVIGNSSGDEKIDYYSRSGRDDYALIEDFRLFSDRIQTSGQPINSANIANFSVGIEKISGARIFLADSPDETIAIVKDITAEQLTENNSAIFI